MRGDVIADKDPSPNLPFNLPHPVVAIAALKYIFSPSSFVTKFDISIGTCCLVCSVLLSSLLLELIRLASRKTLQPWYVWFPEMLPRRDELPSFAHCRGKESNYYVASFQGSPVVHDSLICLTDAFLGAMLNSLRPASLPTGKSAIPTPRTSPITLTRSTRCPDGSRPRALTLRSSSTIWPRTTAPAPAPELCLACLRARSALPTCWSSTVTVDDRAAGERYAYVLEEFFSG